MTWSQWMASLDMCIVHVCETWSLFTGLDDLISAPDSSHDSNRRHGQEGDSKDRLVFAGIVSAAHELSDTVASCIQWYRSYKSFLFVTDSQILQRGYLDIAVWMVINIGRYFPASLTALR